jgi:hypothetical protein
MTERPTHLRVVRDSVPDNVDAAVAKALDKTPADRFNSAGEFARALEVKAEPAATPRGRPRGLAVAAGIVGVAAVAVLGALVSTGKLGRRGPSLALRDRTQLTFSGGVLTSAISPDGKQLAFFTKNCTESACLYAIDVQDVGGTATRRILDRATSAYDLQWSPDRRNLIVVATINGRWGSYLVSALGGTPRYLTSGAAAFWAGGDSLLVGPQYRGDSVFTVRVTSLDGAVRDSIRVTGRGQGMAGITVVPDTRWIVTLVVQSGRGLWQVIDRSGKVADQVLNSCTCGGHASSDALWLTRSGTGSEAIVRTAIDGNTGHLSTRQDTLFSGTFTNFSVTADGASLIIDDGTYEYSTWALDLPDVLRGRFPDSKRLLRASTPVSASVSPDGQRLLVRRSLPSAAGRSETRLSVMPFGGGSESPVNAPGAVRGAFWVDSVTVAVSAQTPRGLHLGLVDVRTGAERRGLDLPDSLVGDFDPLPDGWVWIPATNDRLVVQQAGRTREIPKPDWFGTLFQVGTDPGGHRLLFSGWNASTYDSVGVAIVALDGGAPVMWATTFAEGGGGRFLADGSLLLTVRATQESMTLYRVRAPGRLERLGEVPRPVAGVTVSRDLRRATVLVRDYHGDAWMSRVVRP